MRILKVLGLVLAMGGGVVLALCVTQRAEQAVRELTIELMQSIPRMFWVLETQREVAVVTADNGNILLGNRLGHATANRRSHLGIDMGKIKPNDVEVTGRKVSVQLPDPEILDTALDYSTVRMLTKRSGFRLLWDLASGKNIEAELLDLLSKTTPEYTAEDLKAQRLNFVDRLNRQAGELFKAKNLNVEFR